MDRQRESWRDRLAGAPDALELPTDRPRPPMLSYEGATHQFVLDAETTAALNAFSQRHGATVFMTLLAAFQLLMARYSGQDDVVVASPVANRTRTELEGLIGFFVNTLAMRTDLSGDPTFTELLARVRRGALDAYGHQDLPFEQLVEELSPVRDLSRNPLTQVSFQVVNVPRHGLELPGLRLEPFGVPITTTRFDLSVDIVEMGDELVGAVIYSTDRFDK